MQYSSINRVIGPGCSPTDQQVKRDHCDRVSPKRSARCHKIDNGGSIKFLLLLGVFGSTGLLQQSIPLAQIDFDEGLVQEVHNVLRSSKRDEFPEAHGEIHMPQAARFPSNQKVSYEETRSAPGY